MAISKGQRFGLLTMGEVAPDTEHQSRGDKAPARQRVDEMAGKRQWKATATDPSETNSKLASYDVTFLADVQPVLTTTKVLPGMRPIEIDELTAEPKVAGNGEFRYQSCLFRGTGFEVATSSGGAKQSRASGSANSGESTAKAAR